MIDLRKIQEELIRQTLEKDPYCACGKKRYKVGDTPDFVITSAFGGCSIYCDECNPYREAGPGASKELTAAAEEAAKMRNIIDTLSDKEKEEWAQRLADDVVDAND